MRSIALIVLSAALMFSADSKSEDLLEVYNQALQADPRVQSAIVNIQLSEDRKAQAVGAMLPQITGSANWSKNTQDINNGNVRNPHSNYGGTRYNISLTQTLLDFPKFWSWRSAQKVEDQATAEKLAALNKMMLDVVERYFTVLEAEDRLYWFQSEKSAVEKQYEQIKKQYSKHVVKITDLYEVESRVDKVAADVIEAENVLAVAKQALMELTNKEPGNLNILMAGLDFKPLEGVIDEWINVAISQNPELIAQLSAIEAASDNIAVEKSRFLPVVEAQAYYYNTNTGYQSVNLNNDIETKVAAINVTVPIFSGGVTTNRMFEAQHKHEIVKYENEAKVRAVVKETKDAFLTTNTASRRINATIKALASAIKTRESMDKGFRLGVETMGDLLIAQQNEYRAQRDLSQAKYAYIKNRMRFLHAIGMISEENMLELNKWLQAPSA